MVIWLPCFAGNLSTGSGNKYWYEEQSVLASENAAVTCFSLLPDFLLLRFSLSNEEYVPLAFCHCLSLVFFGSLHGCIIAGWSVFYCNLFSIDVLG